MSDIFDIGGSAYRSQHKTSEDYNHRRGGGWNSVDTNKDPRLSRREDGRNRYSPGESPHQRGHRRSTSPSRDSGWRSPKQTSQMYSQQSHQQYQPQPPPPPPIYSEQYNSGYGAVPTTYPGYQQAYQQQNTNNFNQYNQQRSYQPQPPPPPPAQGYNNSQHQQQQQQQQQPGPPGDDYPSTAWAPVQQPIATSYTQQQPPPVPRPPSVSSTAHSETKTDDLKKEAIANELKQQRATLIKQRDDYLRKASVLRRELEKLRSQKHELLSEKSPPRDSQRILRENAKLQLEIQNKLKSINNVVDMLSGIIGDGLKAADYEEKTVSTDNSPKQQRTRKSSSRQPGTDSSNEEEQQAARSGRETNEKKEDQSRYNYIHYDPELHWCRVCDVFPRSAKDLLTHLHSTEHRQVTQEHQLVDTPWHKLPADPELPTFKGAPVKRVPIKGLQFFISATAWYCKLCDVWIGDLHCASLHLKSKNHAHNYSNFVEQNPHWESNWLKDREKAYARCSKAKQEITESTMLSLAPESNEKSKSKSRKNKLDFLDSSKEKKRKKKSKKRKKVESSGSSSSSSSSSNSSTEDESDKAKSIRVAMRNKMRMQAQMILNEEIGNKVEVLEKLIEERNRKKEEKPTPPPPPPEIAAEDNIINQWMTVNPSQDKQIFDNLKGRLKQRQKADEEKAVEAAVEQRRREREREERELKELREREEKEMQERMKAEQEREEREREERERFKERFRRKRRSDSRSPDYYSRRSRSRGRSRSRSSSRKHYRGRSNDRYRPESPDDKYKPKPREYEDEESQFDKRNSDSYKFKHSKSQSSSNSKKLPFIGRMPLFKKKPESGGHSHEHKSSSSKKKKEDYEVRLSKFESGITARPFIPEPGVVHIIKLATPQESTQTRISAENPPPPPKIIPEPPQISETAPPPPMINNVVTTIEETEVQDMELDDAVALPPGVPVAEAKPIARPAGNHLPRDFQEALNIIFPGDQRPDQLAAAVQNDPNLMMQYQYGMQYGMMYSNMQMYDYNNMAQDELVPEEEEELEKVEDIVPPPPPDLDDKEDLAMLGIDAEDMAAQTF